MQATAAGIVTQIIYDMFIRDLAKVTGKLVCLLNILTKYHVIQPFRESVEKENQELHDYKMHPH